MITGRHANSQSFRGQKSLQDENLTVHTPKATPTPKQQLKQHHVGSSAPSPRNARTQAHPGPPRGTAQAPAWRERPATADGADFWRACGAGRCIFWRAQLFCVEAPAGRGTCSRHCGTPRPPRRISCSPTSSPQVLEPCRSLLLLLHALNITRRLLCTGPYAACTAFPLEGKKFCDHNNCHSNRSLSFSRTGVCLLF